MKLRLLVCVAVLFALPTSSFAGEPLKCSEWLKSQYKITVSLSAIPVFGWLYGLTYAEIIDSMRRDAEKLEAAQIVSNPDQDQYTLKQIQNSEMIIDKFYEKLTNRTTSRLRKESLIDFMIEYDSSSLEMNLCRTSAHTGRGIYKDISFRLMLLSKFGGGDAKYHKDYTFEFPDSHPEDSIEWYKSERIKRKEYSRAPQAAQEIRSKAKEEYTGAEPDLLL